MSKNKHVVKGFLLLFVAIFATVFFSNSAFAESRGIITDANDIRWEYILDDSLTIRFFDKPANATTVTIPSLDDLKTLVPGAPADLDTYFLKSADPNAQDTAYPSITRRQATADTTKLDMSNTAKIQIIGVKPIINPAVETELVFGNEMVIGDEAGSKVKMVKCDERYIWYDSWGDYYYCGTVDEYLDIPNWEYMTNAERSVYVPTAADFNCYDLQGVTSATYVEGRCYVKNISLVNETTDGTPIRIGGAFANYKLKLTGFSGSKFNYVGWDAFANSTLHDTNITISGDSFAGGNIFRNTNVERVTIETNNIGYGIFKDCQHLAQVTYDSSVTTVSDGAFEGTNLTSFDFSTTNIKTVGVRAFKGANLTSVNLSGLQRINYRAFAYNNVSELYFPKSINYLESGLFLGNTNLKKVTVAYDTLTSGTTYPFYIVIDGVDDGGVATYSYPGTADSAANAIEELIVEAPYGADEQVSATHLTYDEYRWHYDSYSQERHEEAQYSVLRTGYANEHNYDYLYPGETKDYKFEDDYADVDSKKNVIAPIYFIDLAGLKKVTIGSGYEYIGSSAFYSHYQNTYGNFWVYHIDDPNYVPNNARPLEEINLPEGLLGVGNLAFEDIWSENLKLNLPNSLEFIGIAAFRKTWHFKADFDLPNIKYIGDHAFESSMIQNVTLHDKMYYLGLHAFSNCMWLKNVTIDYDIFSPDLMTVWAGSNKATTNRAKEHAHQDYRNFFRQQFGEARDAVNYNPSVAIEHYGVYADYYPLNHSGTFQKFGKITFTSKAVHEIPTADDMYYEDWAGRINKGLERFYPQDDEFFGHLIADEIDISQTPWKVLPPNAFNNSMIGEVKLPNNLEAISAMAFNCFLSDSELVIPSTVKYIGEKALQCSNLYYSSDKRPATITELAAVKVTSLPRGLVYVGDMAFYDNTRMTADLNAPNLEYIGIRAFQGSNVRDVLIPEGVTRLREGTFANAPSLRNITIDADFLEIVKPGPYDYEIPQVIKDYINKEEDERYYLNTKDMIAYYDETETCWNGSGYGRCVDKVDGKTFETFYTIFSKTMKESTSGTNDGQQTSGDEFGVVTFTDKNTTEFWGRNSSGMFAGLSFGKLDMNETNWKNFGNETGVFYKSKFGTLSLPHALTTIPYASFEYAEIGNSFTIPGTVTSVVEMAFPWTKINGNVTFAGGANEITFGNNIFFRSQIDGTVTLPSNMKTVSERMFMESTVDGVSMPAEGIETIKSNAFYMSTINNEFALPNTLKSVEWAAFMSADLDISNTLPEGLLTVAGAAFYNTDFSDDLVIPSTVTSIGWSAFSTADTDVHYNTVTIRPNLTAANSSNQRVHQLLWNVSVDKLIIDSSVLVAIDRGIEGPVSSSDNGEEFWNMDMKEVVINNLPKITYSAFNMCNNLETVDMSNNTNIREIDDKAFMNDEKLKTVKFSPDISSEDIILGINAFTNTGLTSIGNADSDFNLYAAKFDASAGEVFSKMKALKSVDVPSTFSNAIIPEKTFYDSPELETASVAYKVKRIDNAAFANDNKLKRIFIWGNTVVLDENLPGYEAPISGMGADGDEEETLGPTIPEGTNIYAYSTSPTRVYAEYSGRDDFTGTFYPLDEVLYITANKTYVEVNDDETDFDKDGLIVYAMRRDGVVLESDEWSEFDGNAYPRSEKDLHFDKMLPTIAADPDFGTIWDTPVPMDELDLSNENFADIDYELVGNTDGVAGVRLINIRYTDGYTSGLADTDVFPLADAPITIDNISSYISIMAVTAVAGAVAIIVSRRTLHRR